MVPVPHALVETLYRTDWGRIVATLIGVLGDFDLAEDVAQEAFAAAVAQWPETGVPEHPRAWIIQTARHKAVDRLRRRASYAAKLEAMSAAPGYGVVDPHELETGEIPDDRLRLIFTCCHPALVARRAGRPDAANAVRPGDGGDCARLPRARCDDGAAPGAGEAQDPRCAHSVWRARPVRPARPARRRLERRLSRLLRGVRRDAWALVAHGPLRGGDPSGSTADDADAARKCRRN